MNTNLNCNCPKPQFGMAIHTSENVQRVLKSRVKSLKTVEKLNDIFKKQEGNSKVDISLFANDKTGVLSANVYANNLSDSSFSNSYSENFLSRLFNSSPVKFIKKLAKVADKEAGKIIKKEEIANNLNF